MGVRNMQGSPWHTEMANTPWLFCLCRYKDNGGVCTCAENKECFKGSCIGRKQCGYYVSKSTSGIMYTYQTTSGSRLCWYASKDGVCGNKQCINHTKICLNPFLCKSYQDDLSDEIVGQYIPPEEAEEKRAMLAKMRKQNNKPTKGKK